MQVNNDHHNNKQANRWMVFWTAVGALSATGALIFAVTGSTENESGSATPASTTASDARIPPETTTTDPLPSDPPATDPTSVGWPPDPVEILLTGGPIALSNNLSAGADIEYDFSSGKLSGKNGSYMAGGFDPSSIPSVEDCQAAVDDDERKTVIEKWNSGDYFCVVTSRAELVLVQPTWASNGVNFHVWTTG